MSRETDFHSDKYLRSYLVGADHWHAERSKPQSAHAQAFK